MFIKELTLYVDYLKTRVKELNGSDESYLEKFRANLDSGITYYKILFSTNSKELSLLEKIESTAGNRVCWVKTFILFLPSFCCVKIFIFFVFFLLDENLHFFAFFLLGESLHFFLPLGILHHFLGFRHHFGWLRVVFVLFILNSYS